MRNRILKYTIVFMLFFYAAPIKAQGNENADAKYFQINHTYVLNADGSIDYNYNHSLQLYTSYAFTRRYGETFIIYNPDWQTLEIVKSSTEMADGSIVDSPPNAFNEVLPRFARNAAPYINLREMVVTHTGVEIGATINLEYNINTKSGFFPGLIGKQIAGDRCPVEKMMIVVKVPAGKNLEYYLANDKVEPQLSNEDGFDVYTWTFENLPLIEVESGQPGFDEFCPTLYFSCAQEKNIINNILGPDESAFNLTPQTVSFVKKLVNDDNTDIEKAFTLQKYVEGNIAVMRGNLDLIGYKALPAQEVFNGNVGSKLDKSILLTAMLRKIGISASPALVTHSSQVKNSTTLLGQYENAIVVCEGISSGSGKLYLDPVNSQDSYAPIGLFNKSIFIISDKPKVYNLNSFYKENLISYKAEGVLNKDGVFTGNGSVVFNGVFGSKVDEEDLDVEIENGLKRFNIVGETISEKNPNDFPNKKYRIRIDSLNLTKEYGLFKIELPESKKGIDALHLPLNTAERTTPVNIPFTFSENYEMDIRLEKGIELAIKPGVQIIKNDVGELMCLVELNGELLRLRKEISINKKSIEPKEYSQLKDLLVAWFNKTHRKLYFK